MNWCVPHIVLLKELCDENVAAKECLQGIQGVVLGAHVEHSLVFVVPKIEVLTRAVEVLLKHGNIIVLESVVEWEVSIVIDNVRPRSDLIDDWVLLVDANDMLDRLAFVVLLPTSHEESIVPAEPVKDVFVTVSCAFEKRILSKVVFQFAVEGIVFVLSENLEHV